MIYFNILFIKFSNLFHYRSDDESSDDENIGDEDEEGVEDEEVNEDDETEETEEEIDDDDNNEEKKLEPSKAARIKKL